MRILNKIFIKSIFIIFLTSITFSQTKYITLNVSASGNSEEEAINNALIESLSQINGSKINGTLSVQEFEKINTSNKSQDYFYSEDYSKEINKYTEGIIEKYKIIDSNPSNYSGWDVEVSVTIAKYALSPQTNRKRVAVMPFRISENREMIVNNKNIDKRRVLGLLNQSLVSYFTQTRKFFVADREFVDEIYQERSLIRNGDVPLAELTKLGNDLGVDLILVGVIEDFNTKSATKKFESMNKTFTSTKGIVEISYRLIDVATRQVKYANLYISDSGTDSANADTQMVLNAVSNIGEDILFAIYPLKIEKIDGMTLYIGQGGNQLQKGDIYNVFKLGDEIIDSYTGETLGRLEKVVGVATIENVSSKMSSAKIQLDTGMKIDETDSLILRTKKSKEKKIINVSDKIKERKTNEKDEDEDIW